MVTPLNVLKSGSCEALKAGVHATALGLVVVMGIYNAAAWLRRREPHLAVNAVLYAALAIWERQHVAHHLEERCRGRESDPAPTVAPHAMPKHTRVAA